MWQRQLIIWALILNYRKCKYSLPHSKCLPPAKRNGIASKANGHDQCDHTVFVARNISDSFLKL